MSEGAFCPKCSSEEIARSRSKRFVDTLMKLFRLVPFRCQQCRSRFYLSTTYEQQLGDGKKWRKRRRKSRSRSPVGKQ